MRSLYLILAVTAAVVTCEPQRGNNDIIWYPVDGEEGVFISTIGEKHRTSPNSKWRSHRRARYSGMELPLPLSYDPTENQDPSFFHNANERRHLGTALPIPKVPPSFQNHQHHTKRPRKTSQGRGNQNLKESNFQGILNEIFDLSKHPPAGEYPLNDPQTFDQWGSGPSLELQNQWAGNTMTDNSNQRGNKRKRPAAVNQSASTSNSFDNAYPGQGPLTSNQWSGISDSRPIERPTSSEWIADDNANRPISSSRPSGPNSQSDKLVFPDDIPTPTTAPSNLIPTDPPTMSPCERLCLVTSEFNPVCGSDAVTYSNAGRLKCAQMCGKNVELSHHGNCGRTNLVTPLVSNSRKQKFIKFFLN